MARRDEEAAEELETAMEGVEAGEEVGSSWEDLGVKPRATKKATAKIAILDFPAPGIFSNISRKIEIGSETIPTTRNRKEDKVPQ